MPKTDSTITLKAALVALSFGAIALCASAFAEGNKNGATSAAPSDAQIAEIVITANQADIDAGKLALSKSSNPEVKDLANHMIADHTASNKKLKAMGVTPKISSTSQSLKDKSQASRKKLEQSSGSSFDKMYVDQEVAFHEKVLNDLDTVLIPSAKSKKVKDALVATRPTIEQHLAHAKMLQEKMGSGDSKQQAGVEGSNGSQDVMSGNSSPAGTSSSTTNEPSS